MRRLPDSPEETIVAISTPPGRGAIGIIRLSGAAARDLVERFFRSRTPYMNRLARPGVFAAGGEVIDQVVVTVFEGPRSYTGEDLAEISAHGNPRVLERMVDLLVSAGARRAGPGEFTLRAVSSGKLDISQAEAVRDFVAAQTDRQARTALLQLEGGLSRRVGPIREAMVALVAEIEAAIDFAEDDVPPAPGGELASRVEELKAQLDAIASTYRGGRILGEGLRLTFAGRPNVGKSSLFNVLVGQERAIVTDVPGTTRDVVDEQVEIEGVPVRLRDTAGIRESADLVESLGIVRAREAVGEADLVLVVLDLSRPLVEDDEEIIRHVSGRSHLVILNKSDLPWAWNGSRFEDAVAVSASKGTGIGDLRTRLVDVLGVRRPPEGDDFLLTNRRQHEEIEEASRALGRAAAALKEGTPQEMVALDLYAALAAIGAVTGEVTTDDILGRIFSTFCIGK